jgi:eukaryotic-like serine/threonine-protein kinase
MQSERWQKCADIFNTALEYAVHERSAYLDQSCAGDKDLRRHVDLLLRSYQQAGGFIEAPAFESSPEFLLGDGDTLTGRQFGYYRIDSVLGVGGMGVVYLAHDERLGRKVALKLLPLELATDARQLEKLKLEARTASALNHPNIVTIHEIGEVDERHYIATEFIKGKTLRDRINEGPIPPNEAIAVAQQIASALSVAHEVGIVHRDIKPENIMLRPDGYVKVLDFGIAKFVQPDVAAGSQTVTQNLIIGTVRYMAPEQARGLPADARSDIWSLGVIMYEMIDGQPPFPGETNTDVVASVLRSNPPPIDRSIPTGLQQIINRCLAKDPGARFQTASELRDQLQSGQSQSLTRRAWWSGAAALVLVALIGGWAWWAHVRSEPRPAGSGVLPAKSIAVLPFDNLSRDPDNAYFVDGVQDEILTRLAKIADLKVISRTSTQRFTRAKANLPDIAKQLGVANLLEGSVQRSADQVRVNVQLINAVTEEHLWADTYDRKLTDIFTVETEIAKAIADTLQAKLTGSEKQMVASQPTTDMTAYDLYHKGRSHWEKRSGDNIPKAIGFYEQAIARDPNYALAYAGLADAYGMLPLYTGSPRHEAARKAKEAALKALRLDPNLAEAHAIYGELLYFYDVDVTGSLRELQRAVELKPNYASARQWYGNNPLAAFGRFEEAINEGERAVELDPLSPVINSDLGGTLYWARRYEEAAAQLHKTLELDPTFVHAHYYLGAVLLVKGDFDGAIAEFEKAKQFGYDASILGLIGAAKARAGDKNAALRALRDLDAIPQDLYSYARALLHLSLDQKDEAMRWLERGYEDGDGSDLSWINVDPLLDELRGNPRFEALVQKVLGPKR